MINEFDTLAFQTESGDVIYIETTAVGDDAFLINDEFDVNESLDIKEFPLDNVKSAMKRRVLKAPLATEEPKKFEQVMGLIAPIAKGIARAVNDMEESERPSEYEVFLKATLTSGVGLKIVTLSSQANFEIKLSWKK